MTDWVQVYFAGKIVIILLGVIIGAGVLGPAILLSMLRKRRRLIGWVSLAQLDALAAGQSATVHPQKTHEQAVPLYAQVDRQ